MVIGIVSDTHGDMHAIEDVLARPEAARAEVWLHAGDVAPDAGYVCQLSGKMVYAVAGNCDWPSEKVKDELVLDFAGHRLFLAHGHTYGVRRGTDALVEAARQAGADIAVYGHTHVAELADLAGGILVLNPGSAARPRDAAERSFMLVELEADEKPAVELIRLAKKIG